MLNRSVAHVSPPFLFGIPAHFIEFVDLPLDECRALSEPSKKIFIAQAGCLVVLPLENQSSPVKFRTQTLNLTA